VGFLPDWLTGWIASIIGAVGPAVATAIHWAVHALAVVVLAVFDKVFGAWRTLAGWSWGFILATGRALGAVGSKLFQIVRVLIPRVIRELLRWVAFLLRFIRSWVAWLWRQIRATIALLYREIGAVIRWAVTHIWEPLWRWAQFLFRLIRAWAWVAFWWITHLASLAEAMVFHIAAAIERHAWQLAGLLGRFFLALLIRNLARFVRTVEAIIAAVL
jgi:hypothetical protein